MSSSIRFYDKPRQLKYTLSSIRKYRAAAGEPLWKVRLGNEDYGMKLMDSEVMTRVIWAGLLHLNEKGLSTYEEVERMIEKFMDAEHTVTPLYEAIAAAFEESGLYGLKMKRDEVPEEGNPPLEETPINP